MKTQTLTKEYIQELLKQVKDPEIPVISVVDLGIVQNIQVAEDRVEVDLVPTFAGCPAIEMMRNDIEKTCREAGISEVKVNVVTKQAWTSDQISDQGRKALKGFGISPPPKMGEEELSIDMLEHAECPKCGSTNTKLKNSFGPTACRAIHFCEDCHETFEQMKPL